MHETVILCSSESFVSTPMTRGSILPALMSATPTSSSTMFSFSSNASPSGVGLPPEPSCPSVDGSTSWAPHRPRRRRRIRHRRGGAAGRVALRLAALRRRQLDLALGHGGCPAGRRRPARPRAPGCRRAPSRRRRTFPRGLGQLGRQRLLRRPFRPPRPLRRERILAGLPTPRRRRARAAPRPARPHSRAVGRRDLHRGLGLLRQQRRALGSASPTALPRPAAPAGRRGSARRPTAAGRSSMCGTTCLENS